MKRRTILLVEDEPNILKRVRTILACEKNYDVRCAVSAAAGLQLGLNLGVAIDLLLVNVMVNGMPGTDLAVQIKAVRPAMHVILLDGKGDGKIEVLDHGWQLIQKRHVEDELLVRVRRELEGQSAGGAGG